MCGNDGMDFCSEVSYDGSDRIEIDTPDSVKVERKRPTRYVTYHMLYRLHKRTYNPHIPNIDALIGDTPCEFSMSKLKKNVLVSLMGASIFGISAISSIL